MFRFLWRSKENEKKKISELSLIKTRFKNMMYSNNALTTQGEEIFNTIWDNQQLRGSLFGELDEVNDIIKNQYENNQFQTLINNTNSDLYQFIKVQ